jgi:hypothetical protein
MSLGELIESMANAKLRNAIPTPDTIEYSRRMAEIRRRWFRDALNAALIPASDEKE